VRQKPPHLRINDLEVGQNKLPKWAEYSCQTQMGSGSIRRKDSSYETSHGIHACRHDGEEEDVSIREQPCILERLDDAAVVPVEVLDHCVIPGEFAPGLQFDEPRVCYIRVNISSDQAKIGAGPAQRPNVSGNPNDGPKTPQRVRFFVACTYITFGNAPRNAVLGPGLQEFDFSIRRTFK